MNAGIINCLTAKGSSGQKAKSQRFTNTGGFLGGNHPPHVRNKGNLRKKSALNFHFQNVCSQLCFEEIRKPSEMNPPNQSRYSTTDVKLTLPMSPNVLHFRAVCHTAGSKRNCQNPPTVSVFRGPPQTRTEKLEARTATNGARSYESLDVLIQHQW